MADIRVRPIVIPRAWDDHRVSFAVLFNFEIPPPAAAPGTRPNTATTGPELSFENWPSSVAGLGWYKQGDPERLTPAQAAAQLHLEVVRDGGAGSPAELIPISWNGTFDGLTASDANAKWQAIFGDAARPDAATAARRSGGLASIFRDTPAPASVETHSAGQHYGNDVSINPQGGSDLRPTQRIESLELTSAQGFLSAADIHTGRLAKADRHELAKAKAVAFQHRAQLSQLMKSPAAGQDAVEMVARALSSSVNLEASQLALVTSVHLAHEAAGDSARLQRSIDLARNRPTRAIPSDQVTHPNQADILARVKKHPAAMRVLGLVMHCTAPFDPGASRLVTGTIALRLGQIRGSIQPLDVRTHFELNLDADGLTYFRAKPRDDGELDGSGSLWKRFHLLPPAFFSLRQDDPVRTLIRASRERGHRPARRSLTMPKA